MPKGIYERTKATGFLHPRNDHLVHVIGIGEVYRGPSKREAHRAFKRWVKFAGDPIGRASGKTVVRMVDGKIAEKKLPKRKNIITPYENHR